MRIDTTMKFIMLTGLALSGPVQAEEAGLQPEYTIAFASFAPVNSDLFTADADGSNAKPLLPHAELDYNASFSKDGKWVVFTSERNGSTDIYRAHPDASGLERLTDHPAFDDQGALSPDGKSLAFVSSRSGQADIWLLDLETGKTRNLTDDPGGDFRPAWSPDGTWIAFSSDRNSKKPRGFAGFETLHSTEIFLIRPDGTGLRQMTHRDAFAGSPTWSADGEELLFYEAELNEVNRITAPTRLRGVTQLAKMDVQTGARRVLTSEPGEKWSPHWLPKGRIAFVSGGPDGGLEFTTGRAGARGEFGSPSWSADGQRMVFHREVDHNWPPLRQVHSLDPQFRLVRTGVFPSYSPSGEKLVCMDATAAILSHAILLMNADGSQRSVLFNAGTSSPLSPAWSPHGDQIVFGLGKFFQTVQGRAAADIATIDSDGHGLRMLTSGSGNSGFPSWSPDGRQIVFRRSGGENDGLFIMDVNTGAVRSLVTGSNHDNFPAWSPRDDMIAFTTYRDGDYEIYTIKADGTGMKRLTRSPGNDAHCSWSPDGQWLAFSSARGGFKDEAVLHPYNPQPYGDIFVMRADGTDTRRLTDNQYEEATLTWAPQRKH